MKEVERSLERYYEAFEAGVMSPEDAGGRLRELKLKKAELEQEFASRTITPALPASLAKPERIQQIREAFRQLLCSAQPELRKTYLRILLEDIVLDGTQVTVRPKAEGMLGFLEHGEEAATGNVAPVLGSIQKWRPICKVSKNSVVPGVFQVKLFNGNSLRFNPIQIAEWLDDLSRQKCMHTRVALGNAVGLSGTRVGQYLNLLRLPPQYLRRLKAAAGIREADLRPITVMEKREQDEAIHRILSPSSHSAVASILV